MATYRAIFNNQTAFTFQANFADAADPILLDGDSTPFQVADFRHSEHQAALGLNEWLRSEGGEAWGEEDDDDVSVEEAEDKLAILERIASDWDGPGEASAHTRGYAGSDDHSLICLECRFDAEDEDWDGEGKAPDHDLFAAAQNALGAPENGDTDNWNNGVLINWAVWRIDEGKE